VPTCVGLPVSAPPPSAPSERMRPLQARSGTPKAMKPSEANSQRRELMRNASTQGRRMPSPERCTTA
jgi:hypothetical protein